jgi:hypothetical protein
MKVNDPGDQIPDPGPHQHTDPGAQGADPGPNNEQYSLIQMLKLLIWTSTNHKPYTICTTLTILLGVQHKYPNVIDIIAVPQEPRSPGFTFTLCSMPFCSPDKSLVQVSNSWRLI